MSKRITIFAIILCIIICPGVFDGNSKAYAYDTTVEYASVLSPYVDYSNLEHPSDITSDSSSLYVADGSGVYKYDHSGKYLSGDKSILQKISAFNYSLLFGIGGGKLYAFDTMSSITSVYESSVDAIDIAAVPSGSYESASGRIFLADTQGRLAIYDFRIDEGIGAVKLPRAGSAYLTVTPYEVVNTGLIGIKAISPATINGASCLLIAAQDNMPGSSMNALYIFSYSGFLISSCLREQTAAIDVASYEDNIYYTTRTGIYSLSGQTFTRLNSAPLKSDTTVDGGKLVSPAAISVYGPHVFVLDTAYSAVQRYNRDLTFGKSLLAGGGSDPGRFLNPFGAAVFEDKLYVADTSNNRIQILTATSAENIDGFIAPTAVKVSSSGTIYVADSDNSRITIISGAKRETLSVPDLTDMEVSSDGYMYYSTNAALYRREDSKSNLIAYLQGIKAFSPHVTLSGIVALTDTALYRVDLNGFTSKYTDILAEDICIDYNKNVYLLSDNKINRYIFNDNSYSLDRVITVSSLNITETPGILCSIAINHNPSPLAGVGSIILCDSSKNILRVLTKEQTGVIVYDFTENFVHTPDYNAPGALDTVSVMEIAEGTLIYNYPSPGYPTGLFTKAGDTVVLLNNDIPGYDFFVYCLYTVSAETEYNGGVIKETAVAGYVYRTSLTLLPNSATLKFSTGRILFDCDLYKYPSLYSEKLMGSGGEIISLQKGDTITTKPFAYPYHDNANADWIAIDYEGKTAFVNSLNVISKNHEPVVSQEKDNASIKADPGVNVDLYTLINGYYVKLDEPPLQNGQKIRVPDRFDSMQKYTRIIIYSDLGMIECYVLTEFIKYNSFSTIQVIAAAIMLVTAATALVLFFFKKFYKKRAR